MRTMRRILAAHGFELARQKKHKVFKHGDGRTFVIASTESDRRAEQNAMHDFARLVGLPKQQLLDKLRRRQPHIVSRETDSAYTQIPEVQEAVLPPANPEPSLSRSDRKLAKRIARLDRNRTAKENKRWELIVVQECLHAWFNAHGEDVVVLQCAERCLIDGSSELWQLLADAVAAELKIPAMVSMADSVLMVVLGESVPRMRCVQFSPERLGTPVIPTSEITVHARPEGGA